MGQIVIFFRSFKHGGLLAWERDWGCCTLKQHRNPTWRRFLPIINFWLTQDTEHQDRKSPVRWPFDCLCGFLWGSPGAWALAPTRDYLACVWLRTFLLPRRIFPVELGYNHIAAVLGLHATTHCPYFACSTLMHRTRAAVVKNIEWLFFPHLLLKV